MSPETLLALISFAIVTSLTPGPNNIMLTASGVNFGYRKTIPHIMGVCVGFVAVLLAAGFGIGALLMAVPFVRSGLQIFGIAYMIWLAWRLATANPNGEGTNPSARPMRFAEAALFQWVNPKGLLMALSAMSVYVRPDHTVTDVLTVTAAFAAVSPLSASAWAVFGMAVRTLLRQPSRVRAFNFVMAALLIISIVPMIRPDGF